jgi:hypothetical protein
VCGPAGLVTNVVRAARSLDATYVQTEAFDVRGGFGPDLSVTVEELLGR